jgi:hypothetical protein
MSQKSVGHMTPCSQCGKPAVFELNGHPICVDCNLKVQQAAQIRDNMLKEQENFLLDQMDAAIGMGRFGPRHKIQPPVAPVSINFDRSVVGAINTGNVKNMEVALNNIHVQNGNAELEKALKEFTEAVLNEKSLAVAMKDGIVEQLSVLAAQAALPKESRLKAVMYAMVTNIGASIPVALIEHWDKIKAMLGF